MKIVLIYMGAWLGLVVLAIMNGVLRQYAYGRCMQELSAHQLSTVIGLSLFGLYICFLTGLCRLDASRQALLIGLIWLIMTVAFEFLFGHYVTGHSWSRLLQDYNLMKGRLWLLVLIWTALAPYFFYRIRSL